MFHVIEEQLTIDAPNNCTDKIKSPTEYMIYRPVLTNFPHNHVLTASWNFKKEKGLLNSYFIK